VRPRTLQKLDDSARWLVARLHEPMGRAELTEVLTERGLTRPEAMAVLAYAVASGLLVERAGLLVPPGRFSSSEGAPPAGTTRQEPHSGWILVVEDEEDCASALKDLLDAEGLRPVSVAHHGKHALRLLALAGRPSLILLDLMMPEMNGWELLEILREDPELRDVPVVVLTASREKPPNVPVVRKPFRVPEVLSVVERAMAASA